MPAPRPTIADLGDGQAPPPFGCTSAEVAGAVRVAPIGELDLASVPRLDLALREAGAPGAIVVVDLRGLDFIDGSGVELLVQAHRRIRDDGGRMVVVPGTGMVAWFLELVGIDRVLEVVGRPSAAGRGGSGHARVVPDASTRRQLEAMGERETSLTELLAAVTDERDDLRIRVDNLERELLALVYQSPARSASTALRPTSPA